MDSMAVGWPEVAVIKGVISSTVAPESWVYVVIAQDRGKVAMEQEFAVVEETRRGVGGKVRGAAVDQVSKIRYVGGINEAYGLGY